MKEVLNALIVDDESAPKKVLTELLRRYCPNVIVVGIAQSVPEAVQKINKLNPDIVFLDIEMPGLNGFQLFDFFDTITFDVIFVTAYNQYAVQAFEVSAIDYLMKPVSAERLIKAVSKVTHSRKEGEVSQRELVQHFIREKIKTKLTIETMDKVHFIDVADIIRVEAEGAYCTLYLYNQEEFLVSRPLADYDKQLTEEAGFFRIHRSHLVNIYFVETVDIDNAMLQLIDGSTLPIARTRKNEFNLYLKGYQK